MWDIKFHEVDWREGLLTFDGEPLSTYMCVNKEGQLKIGLQCLRYFAQWGCPFEDIVLLWGILIEKSHDELYRKLNGKVEDPIALVKEIIRENEKEDRKKRK
jgi:hypothetical protein